MKLHELAEQCAKVLTMREEINIGVHGYIALVVQSPARLPFRGQLTCAHEDGRRVYHVPIHQVFAYLARATKPTGERLEGGE